MIILAIDLGKFNSMCCFFDTDSPESRFQPEATMRRYLTALLQKNKIDLVVMEACGLSGWISDLYHQHGLKTLVCSTNDDASKLAGMATRQRPIRLGPPVRQIRGTGGLDSPPSTDVLLKTIALPEHQGE